MGILENYIKQSGDIMKRMYPELKEKDIEKYVKMKVMTELKDPTVIMDNNVTNENHKITLSRVCDWIDSRNPVISGNGTFYCQPDEIQSPTSNMLKEMKIGRKSVKKEMFAYPEDSYEYKSRDLKQGNLKVVMNAEYGGSGSPVAAFYTKYSPPATTLMAQSIITTMAAFFEAYVGDNQKFFHSNELFEYIDAILLNVDSAEILKDWVSVPSQQDVVDRLVKKFPTFNKNVYDAVSKYINSCTDAELVYIYYGNNLHKFIENHPKIQKYIHSILASLPLYEAVTDVVPKEFADKFSSAKKYNEWVSEVMFLNPYNIPDVIKKDMSKLVSHLDKYVFVEYITPDSIVKLNNHKRNTVILVDTDSNVINSDMFVRFLLDDIFGGESFHRDRMYNEMICVNILASVLDEHVIKILDYYGRCHNMDAVARTELTMKNEFMFRLLFLMKTKKRYAASIVLREGNIMMPFKSEFKGLDFIKAGVTDNVKNIFTNILRDNILFSDEPNLYDMMKSIKALEKDIYNDLRNGGTLYLKPQMYKPMEAYKTNVAKDGKKVSSAWSLPVFKGSSIWNLLYPEQKINSMDRVKLVKLTALTAHDIDGMIDKYPEMYNNIISRVFNSNSPEIMKTGIKVICIPNTVERIPEWMIDYIDYDITISNVIGSFRSVLDSLDIEEMRIKTPNGQARIISSIISI